MSSFHPRRLAQMSYHELKGSSGLLSLVRVRFMSAMNMNGLSRPCSTTGPKRAPSMAIPPAIRLSLSMAAAVAAPPSEWPNMPTLRTLRPFEVPGISCETTDGLQSWSRTKLASWARAEMARLMLVSAASAVTVALMRSTEPSGYSTMSTSWGASMVMTM